MTLPGVFPEIGDGIASRSLPSDTGTAFLVGPAERGPVGAVIPFQSTRDWSNSCGGLVSWSFAYQTVKVSQEEGLSQGYFVRVVGSAAAKATKTLTDGSKATLEVIAASEGEWGNSVKAEVIAGTAGNFKLRVYYADKLVASSGELADNAAAVTWAAVNASGYVTLKDLGGADPKAEQSVTLTGGSDDRPGINAKVIADALKLFTPDLGKGQVAVPGNTAEDVQAAVIAHCKETWRTPFLAAEDSEDETDVIAQALALQAVSGARQAALFDQWEIAPGSAPGTTITVPPEARALGQVARVDAQTGNASEPAAGDNGKAQYVIGLVRTRTDAQREALNDAGVNVSILEDGVPTTYGWRTLADPINDPRWVPLNVARVMVGIAHDARKELKRYAFKKTDAGGKNRAAAESAVRNNVLKPLVDAEALFDAGSVSVTQVTNPTDGSVAKYEAEVGAAPVKFAEQIPITVVATS